MLSVLTNHLRNLLPVLDNIRWEMLSVLRTTLHGEPRAARARVVYLLLSLFGFSIVAYALLQYMKLNKYLPDAVTVLKSFVSQDMLAAGAGLFIY